MDLSPKQFGEIITLTRSGTATRVNSSGLIETVAADTPRFDYDPVTRELRGLLIEEARTNLALQSETFDNATWAKANVTVTANAGLAPDFNAAADKVIPGNTIAHASAAVVQNFTKAASALSYTFSIFAKASGFNRIQIMINDSGNSANRGDVIASLTDGSIAFAATALGTFTSASAIVVEHLNGWYRVALTVTTGTETAIQARVLARDSVATTGDGASGIVVWGAQLELNASTNRTFSSYIPTTTAAVTRGNETPYIGGNTLAQVCSQTQGTLFAVVRPMVQSGALPRIIEIGTNTSADRIIVFANSAGTIHGIIDVGSVRQATLNFPSKWVAGTRVKCALAYQRNDVALAVDGALQTTSTPPIELPALTELGIGSARYSPLSALSGWIESLRYFPTRLTNAQIQALTA